MIPGRRRGATYIIRRDEIEITTGTVRSWGRRRCGPIRWPTWSLRSRRRARSTSSMPINSGCGHHHRWLRSCGGALVGQLGQLGGQLGVQLAPSGSLVVSCAATWRQLGPTWSTRSAWPDSGSWVASLASSGQLGRGQLRSTRPAWPSWPAGSDWAVNWAGSLGQIGQLGALGQMGQLGMMGQGGQHGAQLGQLGQRQMAGDWCRPAEQPATRARSWSR